MVRLGQEVLRTGGKRAGVRQPKPPALLLLSAGEGVGGMVGGVSQGLASGVSMIK